MLDLLPAAETRNPGRRGGPGVRRTVRAGPVRAPSRSRRRPGCRPRAEARTIRRSPSPGRRRGRRRTRSAGLPRGGCWGRADRGRAPSRPCRSPTQRGTRQSRAGLGGDGPGENLDMETPEERQDQELADQTASGGEGGGEGAGPERDEPGPPKRDEGGEGNEGEGPAEGDE